MRIEKKTVNGNYLKTKQRQNEIDQNQIKNDKVKINLCFYKKSEILEKIE